VSPLSRRTFLAGLAAAPVLSACGGGDDDDAAASTTTEEPSTTEAPSTTTTAPPLLAPLLGVPFGGDPAILQRPALIIKINNVDTSSAREQARPQQGLNQADMVFEERTEGGITRFAAVFHSTDSDPVLPVRSARLTDIDITSMFNRPLFANSGGNSGVMQSVRDANLVPVGHSDVGSGVYYRVEGRVAPHNLATSTQALYALAPEGMLPPPVFFKYREAGAAPTGGTAARGVRVEYGGGTAQAPVQHEWVDSASGGGWARTQRDTPHVDTEGVRIAPANVAVQFIPYDNNRGNLGGSGEAWVFTGGQVIQGTWHRPDLTQPTIWKDATGAEILFAPGRTWILLPPAGGATLL
jgi:hypothetical protein